MTSSSATGEEAQVSGPRSVQIRTTAGGLQGAWHDPDPQVEVKGVAVLAPGVAVSARVLAFADTLAARGWRTLRIEFHGVASSADPSARRAWWDG